MTIKAVERTAEAIGDDKARSEQREIQRAVQLDLPIVAGDRVPILYVQMDGTGVPVVKKDLPGSIKHTYHTSLSEFARCAKHGPRQREKPCSEASDHCD